MKINPHTLGIAAAAGYLILSIVMIVFSIFIAPQIFGTILTFSINGTTTMNGMMMFVGTYVVWIISGYVFGYVLAYTYNRLT